jgi:hypothetical protein
MASKSDDDELPLIRHANCPIEWRHTREVRFIWRQHRTRAWISFHEIAEWLSEIDGRGVPNEAARIHAYNRLSRDLLAGDFDERGKTQVLYLHDRSRMARMTRQRLSDALDIYSPEDVRSEYLAHCWLPRRLFQRWLARHELPPSPARFVPHSPAESTPLHPDRLGRTPPWRHEPERGRRRPIKLEQTKEAMRREIQAGEMTPANLTAMIEKELACKYSVSRDTARKARNAVLSEFVAN